MSGNGRCMRAKELVFKMETCKILCQKENNNERYSVGFKQKFELYWDTAIGVNACLFDLDSFLGSRFIRERKF